MADAAARADTVHRAPASLPTLVRAYLERAVPRGTAWPRRVRLEQRGTMCLRRRGKWRPFWAHQDVEAERTFFEWRACLKLVGPLAVAAVDRLDGSRGTLDVTVGGLHMAHAEGEDTDVGELMRYLAELPWNPGAMALHPTLQWADRGQGAVDVQCAEGARRAAVRLRFDDSGDVVEAIASRPRREGKRVVPTPWCGRFSEYRTLGGIRLPTRAEVRWELPDGPHPYFRGEITDVTVCF